MVKAIEKRKELSFFVKCYKLFYGKQLNFEEMKKKLIFTKCAKNFGNRPFMTNKNIQLFVIFFHGNPIQKSFF